MGGQTGKYLKKGMDYVTGTSSDDPVSSNALSSNPAIGFKGTPFVLTRSSSQYFDEDGHLAHEFYRETSDKSSGKVRLKKITKGLHKQIFHGREPQYEAVFEEYHPMSWAISIP